jgi:lipopolysaccharide biosynthesis glycosyltransferase
MHAPQGGDAIAIVSLADDRFAMPLAVTLFSALRRLDPARPACVFILEDGVSRANKARIERVLQAAHTRLQVEWRRPNLACFQHLPITAWYTRATLLRLLTPTEVPEAFDRAILIDSDVVVEKDLAAIWDNAILGDHLLLAVENYSGPTVATELEGIYEGLGLAPDTAYFNAGIMVMNLRRWRSEHVTGRVVAFLERFGERATFMEQDGLNAVVAGDWGKLDPCWNVQIGTLRSFHQDLADARERQRLQDQLLAAPGILHYTGPRKPWHWRYKGPADEAFFRCLLACGWFDGLQGSMFVAPRRLAHVLCRMMARAKKAALGLRQRGRWHLGRTGTGDPSVSGRHSPSGQDGHVLGGRA